MAMRAQEVKKTVLTFDICSSSDILEDLARTEKLGYWRRFIVRLHKYIKESSDDLGFKLYKFTGDGWILLFEGSCTGEVLFNFIQDFSEVFEARIQRFATDHLESPPEILGLTFGMDRGTLLGFSFTENQNRIDEYIGRAINVACRLQNSIKDKDREPQYKALMTKTVYNDIRDELDDYKCVPVQRTLRNIAGGKEIGCIKVRIPIS